LIDSVEGSTPKSWSEALVIDCGPPTRGCAGHAVRESLRRGAGGLL